MLALLRDRLGDEVTIEIVLNPVDNLSKLPLTSYYRYVVPTMSAEEAPKAIITNVPTTNADDARRFPRGVDGDDAQGIV